MNCHKIRDALPLYRGNDLSWMLRMRIKHHIAKCRECREELQVLRYAENQTNRYFHDIRRQFEDTDLWNRLIFQLPKNEIQLPVKKRHAHTFLRPVLAAALLILIAFVIFLNKRPAESEKTLRSFKSNVLPLVETINRPDATIMTFQTDDPKVKIVWIFENDPTS